MAFTFFFRDQHVLDLAVRHLMPEIAGRSRPSIWDAGCAMGQEPYTLAILLAQQMGHFAFNNLRILATDIDESGQFGRRVGEAEYAWEDLERMPAGVLEGYFEPIGPGRYRVVERIRSRVTYRQHDLLTCEPAGSAFSLIVCKNVLLHFHPEQRVAVMRMFHGALAPGGLLVTEQTQKLPPELDCCFERVVSDGQLFRRIENADARVVA